MNKLIRTLQQTPSAWTLFLVVLAALPFQLWIRGVLDASYAASKFPVPYFVQQMAFSAEKMKGWYAYMAQQGTLGQYITTQHIDFVFMLSVLALHMSVLLLISRGFAVQSLGRRVMVVCALLSALAPIADAFENLVSYVMLSDISGFPDYLAYVISTFSVIKFGMFVFAYLAVPLGALAAAWVFMKSRNASPRSLQS